MGNFTCFSDHKVDSKDINPRVPGKESSQYAVKVRRCSFGNIDSSIKFRTGVNPSIPDKGLLNILKVFPGESDVNILPSGEEGVINNPAIVSASQKK